MTDHNLASALVSAKALELDARAYWSVCMARQDCAEADAALNVLRHITATRKSLETWISTRAVRDAQRLAS